MSARPASTSARDSEPDPLAVLEGYDFELPDALIAERPAEQREKARLMVLDRDTGDRVPEEAGPRPVGTLPSWLRRGDLLVVNATRVLAARLVGRKESGGMAEALLLEPGREADTFRALLKCTGRVRVGLTFDFGRGEGNDPASATVVAMHGRGEVTLRFAEGVDPYGQGFAPLPPYILRSREASARAKDLGASEQAADDALDAERYQTVFAREPGAIAAPTAGLHLSESLLADLEAAGIERAEVILHVGAGTFRPLDPESMASGRLHEERFELPLETAEAIARARARGGRVIAVGTTTTRVLESRARVDAPGLVEPGSGVTDLFIRPDGPPFQVVDGLLTNFHLPKSSLLLLVAAFVGREPLLSAYAEAIADGFRFYSYGDAMLIAPLAADSEKGGGDG